MSLQRVGSSEASEVEKGQLVLTPQAGAFVHGGQALADGTIWGSSSRLLVDMYHGIMDCPNTEFSNYVHSLYREYRMDGLASTRTMFQLLDFRTLFPQGLHC